MIIFRGWGILTFLFAVLFIGGAAQLADRSGNQAVLMPLGIVLTGVASWFAGVHLNKTRPNQKVDAYLAQRAEQIRMAVESGTFAPGGIRPTSLEQARAQGQALWEAEAAELRKAGNQHTIFFIPMQYAGALIGAIGVVLLLKGLIGL